MAYCLMIVRGEWVNDGPPARIDADCGTRACDYFRRAIGFGIGAPILVSVLRSV